MAMMLIRLTYFSRNRLDHWYGSRDCGIAEILATSVANNLRDCITGALICDERWFVQALEGAESKVSAAFERILRDQRHREVSLVTMQAVAERRFPNFARPASFTTRTTASCSAIMPRMSVSIRDRCGPTGCPT